MVQEPTAQSAHASRFENGSPLVVFPSWLVSLVLHALLLFAVATELKSCGDPAGIGDGEVLREVGIYVKQPAQTDQQVESQPDAPADAPAATNSEWAGLADAPVVADEPPVATVLPSDRPDIVGVGVPEPPRTGGELTTSLQPGREVRPSGLTPPAPGEVSFFGATDTGQSVVFVLDCSSSMARHNAIGVAKSELKASLNQLGRDQKFQIVFYNNTPNIIRLRDVEESELLLATAINRNFAVQFIDSQNATSGTNHMPALKWALHFNPDMIFLLTDADEPVLKPRDFAEIRKLNKAKTRIHCIEFGEYADLSRDKNFLKELAREQRGTYRYYDVTRFSQR